MVFAMSEFELEAAVSRNAGNKDVAALRLEIERLADQLSDCWLLLDHLQSENGPLHPSTKDRGIIQATLRRQGAPGWKKP